MQKIVRKSIWIGIGYYLLVLVNACCNCKAIKHGKYNFTGIHFQGLAYKITPDSLDVTLSDADTFQRKAYGFQLHFDYQLAAVKAPAHSGLLNTAYACKCTLDSFKASAKIEKVTISSVYNFDTNHPAGSDVTGYFSYVNLSLNPFSVHYNALSTQFKFMESLESRNHPLYIDCYLNAVPELPALTQFEVTVQYTNGVVQKGFTKPVTLL